MSQKLLGDLVGRSEDWVSKVERGLRDVRHIDVATSLARALRIELGDLLGQPVLFDDEPGSRGVPAIRDALMAPERPSRTLFGDQARSAPAPAQHVTWRIEHAWSTYQQGLLGRVTELLPELIVTAQGHEDAASSDDRRGWALSARTHHLAAS